MATNTIDGMTTASAGDLSRLEGDSVWTGNTPTHYRLIGIKPPPADTDKRRTVTYNGLTYTVRLSSLTITHIGGMRVKSHNLSRHVKAYSLDHEQTMTVLVNCLMGDFIIDDLGSADPVLSARLAQREREQAQRATDRDHQIRRAKADKLRHQLAALEQE